MTDARYAIAMRKPCIDGKKVCPLHPESQCSEDECEGDGTRWVVTRRALVPETLVVLTDAQDVTEVDVWREVES